MMTQLDRRLTERDLASATTLLDAVEVLGELHANDQADLVDDDHRYLGLVRLADLTRFRLIKLDHAPGLVVYFLMAAWLLEVSR